MYVISQNNLTWVFVGLLLILLVAYMFSMQRCMLHCVLLQWVTHFHYLTMPLAVWYPGLDQFE